MFVHPVHLCSCGYGGFRFDAVLLNSLEPSFPIALTSPRAPDKTAIPFITLCITNELARATARPCACWRSPGSIPVSTPLALADALAAKVATEGSAGHDWRATQYIEIAFGGTASPHVHRPSPLLQAPRQTDVLLPSNYPSFPRLYVTLTTRSSTPENSRTPGVPTASRYPSTKAPQGCCGSRKPLGHTRTIQLAWRSRSGTPASAVAPE